MSYTGDIRKMRVTADESGRVHYQLPIGDQELDMNALIGQSIEVVHNSQIHCVHCGRKTKKSFNQGYCFPCLQTLAQCDTCIIKPELCHYHEGTCREPAWGEAHCLTGHFVYLSNTGNLKVGITRHAGDGISSRWIDQGATQAIVLLRVSERLISGEVETMCKQHIGDKTNWRTMLKGPAQAQDIVALKHDILSKIAPDLERLKQQHGLQAVADASDQVFDIHYPVNQYPLKIKSINLDKETMFSGTITGIKGQYLMLDGDRVINLRKYAGYNLTFNL